jgi:23S rRNA pseudouridine2605 synthase
MAESPQRLQKILAAAGYGSRRQCEEFIKEGRVRVNNQTAELGQKADPATDAILIDDEPITSTEPLVYFMVNKPTGVVSSHRTQGAPATVVDLVETEWRVYPVGRLDADSEGLILLTNDGRLTHRLTHPSFEHEKEYLVWLDKAVADSVLDQWRQGPELPTLGSCAPAWVERANREGNLIRVIMHEGKNRQIRATAEYFGLKVNRLKRLRMGPIKLGNLEPGGWRELTPGEVTNLRRQAGLPLSQEMDGR